MSNITKLIRLVASRNLDIALRNQVREPRRLYRRPAPILGNWSVRRLNALHNERPSMSRYLEIGLFEGRTFENITLPSRIGVDPLPRFRLDALPLGVQVYAVTSDEFFASNDDLFDMVFLDGLHTYRQTYRDMMNALKVCPSGPILIDDVVPTDEVSAMPDLDASLEERHRRGLPDSPWHGDVFRIALCLRDHHAELDWRTIINSGNPQMLLWKKDPKASIETMSDDLVEAYSVHSFADVFNQGIPDYFAPVEEAVAVGDCVAALREHA